MYQPFRGQALYYTIFILPMLTVPVVVAYTAEMMLYQSGPINDLISAHERQFEFKPILAHRSEHRADDRDAARNLELDAVLLHHHACGPGRHSRRSRSKPRRSWVRPDGASSGRCSFPCCGP